MKKAEYGYWEIVKVEIQPLILRKYFLENFDETIKTSRDILKIEKPLKLIPSSVYKNLFLELKKRKPYYFLKNGEKKALTDECTIALKKKRDEVIRFVRIHIIKNLVNHSVVNEIYVGIFKDCLKKKNVQLFLKKIPSVNMKLIRKIIDNIINNPKNEKFQKMKLNKKFVKEMILENKPTKYVLLQNGFEIGDEYLFLKDFKKLMKLHERFLKKEKRGKERETVVVQSYRFKKGFSTNAPNGRNTTGEYPKPPEQDEKLDCPRFSSQAKNNKELYVFYNQKTPYHPSVNQEAKVLFKRAKVLHGNGSFNECLKLLDEITNISPNFSHAHNEKGLIYLQQKNYAKALENHELAMVIQPTPGFINNKGMVFLQMGNFVEAEKTFKSAITHGDKSGLALNNLGMVFYNQKLFSQSLPHFKKAIEQDDSQQLFYKNISLSYFALGNLSFKKGDLKQSLVEIRMAIKAFPNDHRYHLCLGTIYMKLKQFDYAVHCYKNVQMLNPDEKERLQKFIGMAYFQKSKLLFYLKKHRECHDAIQQSLEYYESYSYAWFLLGKINFKRGQIKESLENFKKAIEINEQVPEYVLYRGMVLLELSHYKEGLNDIEISVILLKNRNNKTEIVVREEREKFMAFYWGWKGLYYYKTEEMEKALQCFENGIKVNPAISLLYFYRGRLYRYLEKYDLAIQDFKKAVEYDLIEPKEKEYVKILEDTQKITQLKKE